MPREAVQTHHDRLFKFFLDFFDMRRLSGVHEKVRRHLSALMTLPNFFHSLQAKRDTKLEKEVESIEDAFIDAYLNMVMKLNELTFKPLFLRITHWVTDTTSSQTGDAAKAPFARLFTFWRLANALSDKLKVNLSSPCSA